jgi:hypothetical protein
LYVPDKPIKKDTIRNKQAYHKPVLEKKLVQSQRKKIPKRAVIGVGGTYKYPKKTGWSIPLIYILPIPAKS